MIDRSRNHDHGIVFQKPITAYPVINFSLDFFLPLFIFCADYTSPFGVCKSQIKILPELISDLDSTFLNTKTRNFAIVTDLF